MTIQPQPQSQPPPPWPVPPTHGLATGALVCGIIGLIAVPGLGVIAWILGHLALKEIDAAPPGTWSNRDHATIGKILGIVSTILYAAIFGCVIAFYAWIFAFVIGAS